MNAMVEGFNLAVARFFPAVSIFSDAQVWAAFWTALFIFGGVLAFMALCVVLIYWDIKRNGR